MEEFFQNDLMLIMLRCYDMHGDVKLNGTDIPRIGAGSCSAKGALRQQKLQKHKHGLSEVVQVLLIEISWRG